MTTPTYIKEAAEEVVKHARCAGYTLQGQLESVESILLKHLPKASERWYIGTMNDALFIINTPPRPITDDPWHDRPGGPTMVLQTWPLKPVEVQAIVDAHNAPLVDGPPIPKEEV